MNRKRDEDDVYRLLERVSAERLKVKEGGNGVQSMDRKMNRRNT